MESGESLGIKFSIKMLYEIILPCHDCVFAAIMLRVGGGGDVEAICDGHPIQRVAIPLV